jgi:acyl-coenzyme A thioesterase PaaI-like protein
VAPDGGSSVDPVSIGRAVTVGSADRRVPTVDEINEMVAAAFPGTENMCAAVGADFAVARRIVGPDALRPGGFISGPTQFGVADAALWYLVFGAIGRVEPMALTSELSIRYLRPAQGDVLFARATLDSAGRRNVVGTVRMWCDDREHKPTATAQGTYVLPAA